ncbi:MAG TPA: ribose 5-phosphate isomerase B [Candidatus Woesearchaeota archaeon]|nr:ribose 5-phosphate isomerase B [Candidatus Woesearchaeota archaeon]
MRVILASDHAGYELKEKLKDVLKENDIPFEDLSPEFVKDDDYPDIAFKAGRKVVKERARGVLVCGTGTGMCIAANKVRGVRAALAYDEKSARLSRQHNDSNVLCIGARMVDEVTARNILRVWLTTRFLEGRHARRINKIKEYERG